MRCYRQTQNINAINAGFCKSFQSTVEVIITEHEKKPFQSAQCMQTFLHFSRVFSVNDPLFY